MCCLADSSELDRRGRLCAFRGREVGGVLVEPGHARPNVVWKLKDKRVVLLDRVVVTLARHADAVLCSRQLILQAHELVAGAQLRVVLRKQQQAAQGRIQDELSGTE